MVANLPLEAPEEIEAACGRPNFSGRSKDVEDMILEAKLPSLKLTVRT